MPTRFHHLAIQVTDLPRAERFYCEVLGFEVLRRWPSVVPGVPGKVAPPERSLWLGLGDDGETFLALERIVTARPTAAGDHDPAPLPGHHLVAFRIEASTRRTWEDRLAMAGVVVTHRTAYTLYFTDPEGNRLGLSHHPVAKSADDP